MPGCATMMCCAAAEVLRMHVHLLRQEVRLLFPPRVGEGYPGSVQKPGSKDSETKDEDKESSSTPGLSTTPQAQGFWVFPTPGILEDIFPLDFRLLSS